MSLLLMPVGVITSEMTDEDIFDMVDKYPLVFDGRTYPVSRTLSYILTGMSYTNCKNILDQRKLDAERLRQNKIDADYSAREKNKTEFKNATLVIQ